MTERKTRTPKTELGAMAKSDVARLKMLTHILIQRLEQMLDAGMPLHEQEVKGWQKTHDWLFGAKHPIVDTLATLADLLLMLEKADAGKAQPDQALPEDYRFSPTDVALVKTFIEKIS